MITLKGLLMGLVCLLGALISLIVFHSKIPSEDSTSEELMGQKVRKRKEKAA